MIEFQNVSLSFNNNHAVLNDISFKAHFYEKIAILGMSGGGKTTLLRLMLGLVRPDSGKILIDGQDIVTLSESELRDIRMKFSIVFQEGALFDSLNVRENVVFFFREYSSLSEEEIEKKARELLGKLGIEEAIDLMPEELSGGMKRRVAIARALAGCNPRMVLYDEATSGLDPLTADNICSLINDLAKGEPPERTGFIIVTHKVTDAIKVAERFIYLRSAEIAFDGDISALRNTEDPELRSFTEELHIAEKYI
ncbi:MAG: ATP-binding cassette domain-containing protein [Nitrospiraceae bacterium]|nr:MAG: ATP-binding cassette domain-containing protein [Nitrospiraceae bacterium]